MAQIDIEKIQQLKLDADKIFLTSDGENALVQILEIEKQIEAVKEEVKSKLAEAALKLNPNFSSIQGDKVKVYYREYGAKYYVDETQATLIPEGLAEQKISYSVNSKAVEEWVERNGHMPTGIKEVERQKSISFSLKNNEK